MDKSPALLTAPFYIQLCRKCSAVSPRSRTTVCPHHATALLWFEAPVWVSPCTARSFCVTPRWGLNMLLQNTIKMQKGSHCINLSFSISFNKFIYYPTPFTSPLSWQNGTIMDVKISGKPRGLSKLIPGFNQHHSFDAQNVALHASFTCSAPHSGY